MIIREPRLKPDVNGIPKDFADTKDYFNKALDEDKLPWIPRKKPITDEEIKKLWVPSLEQNICLVAELDERVVGQLTVLYDPKSNLYEHRDQRKPGNIGFAADPKFYTSVLEKIVPKLVSELKQQGKTAVWTMSKESPANQVLKKLGYEAKVLENQERYKEAGLSGKVCEYGLG